MMILYILAIFIAIAWFGGFIYSNDFSVKTRSKICNANRILVVFPHADDEVMTTGGSMAQLSRLGKQLIWVIATQGEKGTADGTINTNLKKIRKNESERVAKIFGVQKLIQLKYADGNLENCKNELKIELIKVIKQIKPIIIITYDQSGLYGHPDHIALSEVVTELAKKNPKLNLIYTSFPRRILNSISLPEHMAKNVDYKKSRAYPTFKIWIGFRGIIRKIKASYTYASQGGGSSRNMPIKWIPMWFYISLTLYEYFHEATFTK